MNNWRVLLAPALAVLAVGASFFGHDVRVATVPAGILLVFVLPGYALAEALRPGVPGMRDQAPAGLLEGPMRVAFILGLSIAVAVVLGLLLNITVGLTRSSWAIGLGAVTIVAALIALFRRGETTRVAEPLHLPIGSLALLLVAGCVAVAAVTADITGAQHAAQPGFTQLWILPSGPGGVRLGVASHETAAVRYSLTLRVRATTVRTWSFALRPGATWHASVKVTGDRSAPRVALLRSSLHPHTTYRKVYLWPSQS